MPAKPTDDPEIDAQTAVVARLLHPAEVSTIDGMHATIKDVSHADIDRAISTLVVHDCVRAGRGRIDASPALKHLDSLGLIAL
jgi:hypothetical protein